MPRVARKDLCTSFFHIIVQGLNKEYIFNNDVYIQKYRTLMLKYEKEFGVKILAYCIMNNHVHILLYTKDTMQMSLYMHSINTKYAQFYNKSKKRVGYVFKNRFLSQPIYNRTYLLRCLAYIHNNPVNAHIVRSCKDYKYSSYNDYINNRGIASEENIEILFEGNKNYKEIFANIHKKWDYFLDVDLNIKDVLNRKIRDYETIVGKKEEDIIKDKNELKKLIIEIKNNKTGIKITNKEISERLNVSLNIIKRFYI